MPLPPGQDTAATLTRRELLRAAALGGGALATGAVLAACGSSATTSSTTQTTGAGTPKRGGNLRVGITGGASSDSLDADNPLTNPDLARGRQLYNALVRYDERNIPYLDLAEEISSDDATGSSWTIQARRPLP
jgi:peptide/nickel transport system substrate-binding protein